MKSSKKNFTLLELFIVITIIGFIVTLSSIQIGKMLSKHNFESCEKKLKNAFSYAKEMALIHQADVYLHLIQHKESLIYEISTGEDQGFFLHQKKQTETLKNVFFKVNEQKKDEIIFTFSSTKEILPKEKIKLFDNKENISKEAFP
jgi:Tfp pilus assembly protein FimT